MGVPRRLAPGDHLDDSVSGAGDVDGDGHDDVLVGAPRFGFTDGGAWISSAKDRAPLHEFHSPAPGAGFGASLAAAGEVDADRRPDVVIGDPYTDLVQVFSGRDGSTLQTLSGTGPGEGLGRSFGLAGDVNGDGRPDLVLGAPQADLGGSSMGSARVVTCRDFLGESLCAPAVPNSTGTPGTLTATGSAAVSENDLALTAASLPPGSPWFFQCAYRDQDPSATRNLTEAVAIVLE